MPRAGTKRARRLARRRRLRIGVILLLPLESLVRRFFAPGAVFLVVFAVRVSYWAALEATPLAEWHLWQETDEWGYVDWSAHLAAGNWMDRPAWRSYFSWQVPYGTPAEWERWYQKDAYFAGPLYPYSLAVLRRMFGSPVLPARLLQLLLACGTAALLARAVENVGKRTGTPGDTGKTGDSLREEYEVGTGLAGIVAGLLYGLYGPLVFHDSFLYRDGPVAHLSTLLLVAPFLGDPKNREISSSGIQKAFAVGVLGGLAMLLKQTVAPLALGSILLLSKKNPGGALSRSLFRRRVLLFGLLGLAIPLAGLAARNIAVGVPPLTFDTRQAIGLAWGNARGADATTAPPESMKAILDAAQGSTLKTAKLVLAGYRGAPLELPKLFLKKLATFFNRFEVPDNANFYFFRDRLRILFFLPIFACLLGAGVVGLFAALTRGALRKEELALAIVAVLTPLAACLLVQTTSRYRIGVAGPLAFGAGLFFLFTFEEIRRRDWRAAGVLVAAAGVVSLVPLLPSAIPDGKHRFADTIVYATLVEARVSPEAAKAEIRRYLEEGGDDRMREVGMRSAQYWLTGDRSNTRIAPEGIAPPERRVREMKESEKRKGESDLHPLRKSAVVLCLIFL